MTMAARAALILFSTAAWFSLAVIGRGGTEEFFSHAPLSR